MNKILTIIFISVFLISCNSKKNIDKDENSSVHAIVIKEVIQASEYTYLRATENNIENWYAVPSFEVKLGETYYFNKGLEMPNFESKELNRTFEVIFFIDKLSKEANLVKDVLKQDKPFSRDYNSINEQASKPVIVKEKVKIVHDNRIISIAKIFSNKSTYDGKEITVRGKITKFNPEIMNKNWVHLQDGTNFNNEFDLPVTTNGTFNVGEIVTLKGKITLNKDFGFGYFYKVILEDAKIIKQ